MPPSATGIPASNEIVEFQASAWNRSSSGGAGTRGEVGVEVDEYHCAPNDMSRFRRLNIVIDLVELFSQT